MFRSLVGGSLFAAVLTVSLSLLAGGCSSSEPARVLLQGPSPLKLAVGEEQDLAIEVLAANGKKLSSAKLQLSVRHPAIATVDASAWTLRGEAAGTTTLVLTAGPARSEVAVVVSGPAPSATDDDDIDGIAEGLQPEAAPEEPRGDFGDGVVPERATGHIVDYDEAPAPTEADEAASDGDNNGDNNGDNEAANDEAPDGDSPSDPG